MRRSPALVLGTAAAATVAAGAATVAADALAAARPTSGPGAIVLSAPLPTSAHQGDTVTITGRVRRARRARTAVLELMRPPGAWRAAATGRVGSTGRFTLRWSVPGSAHVGLVTLRVIARRGHATLARTGPTQSAIASAPVLCAPPVPPAVDIPVGDGWIVGGLYNVGGPFPGIDECDGSAYTVTATDSSGVVQATQNVAAGHSYTLVVPAGAYTLASGFCRGSATVTAGQQTKADTVCPVP